MARTVKVFSTENNNIIEITTSATTWGQLQEELKSQKNLTTDNQNAKVRETKITLEHKDAQLPTGEFTVFLTPAKVKSGNKKVMKVVVKRTTKKTTKKVAPKRKAAKRKSTKK